MMLEPQDVPERVLGNHAKLQKRVGVVDFFGDDAVIYIMDLPHDGKPIKYQSLMK